MRWAPAGLCASLRSQRLYDTDGVIENRPLLASTYSA